MEIKTMQSLCSLEDLLWEHCEFSNGLKSLFEKYQKQIEKEKRVQYDRETQKIIFNTICKIIDKTGINSFEVFIDDFNRSLKMVLVFPEKDLQIKGKDLYTIIPEIQNLSIIHEGRDFRWQIMSDKFLNKDILENEFAYFLKVENK